MDNTVAASGSPDVKRFDGSEKRNRPTSDLSLYILLTVLVFAAWQISRQGYFKAGDNIGYWLGVAGGVATLLLFTYPLRKYMRFTHRWGKVKWWFWVHMFLGISGPLLILLHSTFRIASLNAAVALGSMLTVALSGVIGRFIYVRVHRGLYGERTTLREMQAEARFDQSQTRSKLHFAPALEERLLAFQEHELKAEQGWAGHFRQVCLLPWQKWWVYRACIADFKVPLRIMAKRRGLTAEESAQRERKVRRLVLRYLNSVVKVAQYTAYERIFALWHVVHVPFVYIMIISTIVHVFAVHAY